MLPPPSRRAPCPCGSGKRYKDCHGAKATGHKAGPLLQQAQAAMEAGRGGDAVELLQRAAAVDPQNPEPLFHLGNLLALRGERAAAIAAYERALAAAPAHAELRVNLGITLAQGGAIAEAERCFEVVLQREPGHVGALGNLAQSLFQRGEFAAALPHYDRLLNAMPEAGAEIWNNRGICQQRLGDRGNAEQSFRRALLLAPDSAEVAANLGLLLYDGGNHGAAGPALERAHALDSTRLLVTAQLFDVHLQSAQWADFAHRRDEIVAAVARLDEEPRQSLPPYILLALCDDPALQLAAARRWAWPQTNPDREAPRHGQARRDERLRIGFVSTAFHEHPVPRLLVELLERLDRRRFCVHAYALGRGPEDALRARIRAAVEAFVELGHLAASEIVARIRADGVDMLFDLTGHTGQARPDVFAARPAPVQVNYLGYAGTLGAGYWDFVITDPYTTPPEQQVHFSERFCYVGECYLPCDSQRRLDDPPSRSAYGLPDSAFVFAAPAAPYKILPPHFAIWMRLLRSCPDAVLWLRSAPAATERNLRAEAERGGVDPRRLVFAPTEALPRYLARYALADLFLDTYPFGSHTAVNDALFAGLPALALSGRSMAARASAAQLRAADLAELIATDAADYEAIATALVNDGERLRALRERLRRTGRASSLFDMQAYTLAFESAVLRMHDGAGSSRVTGSAAP